MKRITLIAPIATVATLAFGSAAFAEAHADYDLNGDGMLDYAELVAVVGEDRARELLDGDEAGMLEMEGLDPSAFETRGAAEDEDERDYQTEENPINAIGDDEEGINSGYSDDDSDGDDG